MLLLLNLVMSLGIILVFGLGLPLWMDHLEKKFRLIPVTRTPEQPEERP